MSLISVKQYLTPRGENELLELLQQYGNGALIVAGGSFVHGLEARDLLHGIEALIDIRGVGLDRIEADSDGLSIGAMVTFAELQELPQTRDSAAFGAIRDALTYPPLQIRNVATVGGNVSSSCPYFDLSTALLTLDASVLARGPDGSRTIALQDFFESLFQNSLAQGEFVAQLLLPALPARSASAYIKLESNANDLAIVGAAVRITLDDAGLCREARIAIGGGVAETPVRATASEAALQGRNLSDDVLQEAAAAAQSNLEPMSDHRASAAYRSAMASVLTERALRQALARLDP